MLPASNVVSVRTLAEFTKAIRDLPPPSEARIWFRGQSSLHNWKVRPSLYRRKRFRLSDALYDEDVLRSEFHRLGRQLSNLPRTHWDWYFLMRHFGVPTRLLDWTDNALAALHFAVGEPEDDAPAVGDAVVFALDPFALNAEVFRRARFRSFARRPSGVVSPEWDVAQNWLRKDLFRTKIRVQYPIAINPPCLEARTVAQGSRFTLFGCHRDGLVKLAGALRGSFSAITISAPAIPAVRAELRNCGISHFALFPDLAGLGRQLMLDWKQDNLRM